MKNCQIYLTPLKLGLRYMEEAVEVFGISRGGGSNNYTSFIPIHSSMLLTFYGTDYPIEVYHLGVATCSTKSWLHNYTFSM